MKLFLSKIIFRWYYKRVPEHFHQWPFRKSIKLLIQNYVHQSGEFASLEKVLQNSMEREDKQRDIVFQLRMQQLVGDETADVLNQLFGTGINKASDN